MNELRGISLGLVVIQIKDLQILPYQQPLLRLIDELEVRRQADIKPMLAQNTLTKRVEGRNPQINISVRQQTVNTLLHFVRSLVGKGQRQDGIRSNSLVHHQMRDAVGNNRCLPCSRASDNQKRPLTMRDSL